MKPNKTSFKKGRKHPFFKGKFTHKGYVLLYKPNHPFCDKGGYMKRSRLVMEKKLGRYLVKGEVVHHLNHIRNNDRPKNLRLFSTESKHARNHKHSEATKKKISLANKGRVPWNKGKKFSSP